MPRGKGTGGKPHKRPIDRYEHTDKKRINNPPVGLVTPETDPPIPTHKTYDYVTPVPSVRVGRAPSPAALDYDPHLDPQLIWAGKKEHTSFEVHTASLHVHERIDPSTIIEAVRKRNGDGLPEQPSLFERREENPPLREAIDFYKHAHGWSNRLIAGDSLLVMNSLLEKEGMAGQVQMVYLDPPYGIEYGSNFQPFVNKRMVKDRKDEDLTQEPETLKAFRDTWELGVHSYLTYLRDRLLLSHDLLNESGSCFVQIGDRNVHLIKAVLDDVFGSGNFHSLISFRKGFALAPKGLGGVTDYIVWYAKDLSKLKFRALFEDKAAGGEGRYGAVELPGGERRRLTRAERDDTSLLPKGAKIFVPENLLAAGLTPSCVFPIEFEGEVFHPKPGRSWKTNPTGMATLIAKNRVVRFGDSLNYVLYHDDYPVAPLDNLWSDTGGASDVSYVVQTSTKVVQRCLLMSTDPGDLVFDPTCGSGTTAFVAEQWGRRWITCDTSRVSTTLARQRLMSAAYEYYELAHPDEGVGSGFKYRKVPHVTLGSIAQNEPGGEETLYDRPSIDTGRIRVAGPFTVEAVPAPTVRSLDEIEYSPQAADASVARSGPTLRHTEWRDELLKTGLRGKGGHRIDFSRVEPRAGTRWLHADAETKGSKPDRVVISFGPEHSLLENNQVQLAWEEARTLDPKPAILVFAAFEFDPDAAKDIDGLTKEKTGMTFLTARMNADLLTEDLKKKRASNQSFWLVGRPDVDLRQIDSGEHKGRWQAEVSGFDYYNTRSGTIESGDTSRIAMWMLDTDYDGRSLFPRQVFFPIADEDSGWARLARNLKAEIDPELIESYRGTVSLPFEPGKYKRIAVKVIDDRGIESLKVVEIK